MKIFRNISVIILAVVFLSTTSGIVIYQSNCACSGEKEITVYISPEGCEEDGCASGCCTMPAAAEACCASCVPEKKECDCSDPLMTFLKLKNQFVDEQATFLTIQSIEIPIAKIDILEQNTEVEDKDNTIIYIDPPPIIDSSIDFLIQIHQLKIPVIA